MNYQVTQKDMQVLKQSNFIIHIKLHLLNKSFQNIGEMQGEMIDGSQSENAESDIRNTASVNFYVKDTSYLIGQHSRIWLDKYVRLYIGVVHQRSQEILWYEMGTFLFNENSYTYDATTRTLNVNLVDLMAKLTETRGGQVRGLTHTIPVDSNIRESIIATLSETNETFDYIIEDNDEKVPYDLEFGTGATAYHIITGLRDLYSAWETFFSGKTFVCQKIPTCLGDSILLDYKTIEPLVISESLSNSFANVKNVTDIWGKCLEADRYADSSTNTGTRYNITLEDYELSYNDLIGFKTNTSATSSTLKINSETAYPIVDMDDNSVSLEANTAYVVRFRNLKFYLQGEYQIHYIVKEFSEEPSTEYKEQDIINEGTRNIKYIVNPDSPYGVDRIGEIRQIFSGGDYENIYTEDLCKQRAEYENWKTTRLEDSITLEMINIPWLSVNKKIEYKSQITKEVNQYIIKSINRDLTKWTMNIQMIRFYDLYPFIVE